VSRAAKKEFPIRVNFCGRLRVIRGESVLWSVSEVARTKWPVVGGYECAQMRVRGKAGDRAGRNQLVVNLVNGLIVKPSPKYFVRPDPYDPAAREAMQKGTKE
jgi:hypothetical protein